MRLTDLGTSFNTLCHTGQSHNRGFSSPRRTSPSPNWRKLVPRYLRGCHLFFLAMFEADQFPLMRPTLLTTPELRIGQCSTRVLEHPGRLLGTGSFGYSTPP